MSTKPSPYVFSDSHSIIYKQHLRTLVAPHMHRLGLVWVIDSNKPRMINAPSPEVERSYQELLVWDSDVLALIVDRMGIEALGKILAAIGVVGGWLNFKHKEHK